jgi:Na+/H+ antiporter NhaD/arsenite permease-like protein
MYTILIILFLIGYAAIVAEHSLKINKAGSALLMGVLCWTVYVLFPGTLSASEELHQMTEELGSISEILLFLIGAMTIVEVIDAHDGFRIITDKIQTRNKRKLLWVVSWITFFLSAVLDNLTTSIVMVSLLSRLVVNREDRLIFASMVIVAANAGGAWTPMGDVTTTMLWIGEQLSTLGVIRQVLLPSIVSVIIPLTAFSFALKGDIPAADLTCQVGRFRNLPVRVRNSIFFLGVGMLIFTPVFKALTHMPPYAGMMLGVGVLWVYTGLLYRKHKGGRLKEHLSVTRALHNIEFSTILFFLGILLAVGALGEAGILSSAAREIDKIIGNQDILVTAIGILSAVIDNVPLVAAAQEMYTFPMDNYFWLFLAYAAGTGGSILVIGSAAGVAVMGMEKINFFWYLKRISLWTLVGYLAGALTFIVCSTSL